MRRWWLRAFRPRETERQTEAVLAQVRQALNTLDKALAMIETTKRRRPNG